MIARYSASLSLAAAVLVMLATATPVSAQPRAEPRPRIGEMSDEVALQRLRTEGIENPRVLRREGSDIILQGSIGGRDATLRLDSQRGRLIDADAPDRVLAGPGAEVARPMVSGRQLREPRAELSRPDLMREAIRPQQ